jgi:hypothetical protein
MRSFTVAFAAIVLSTTAAMAQYPLGGQPAYRGYAPPAGTYYMPPPSPQLAPDGTWVGGTPHIAPDGTWVGGTPMIAPNGKWVGVPER